MLPVNRLCIASLSKTTWKTKATITLNVRRTINLWTKDDGDPFQILGIDPGSSKEQIKKRYYKLCQQYHPDRNKSPNAADKMTKINRAYDEVKCGTYRKKEQWHVHEEFIRRQQTYNRGQTQQRQQTQQNQERWEWQEHDFNQHQFDKDKEDLFRRWNEGFAKRPPKKRTNYKKELEDIFKGIYNDSKVIREHYAFNVYTVSLVFLTTFLVFKYILSKRRASQLVKGKERQELIFKVQ
ncbi:hypothetical protein AKO1_013943 [Acrasis kona]|uniref:J domain-containing protein n=1 Tax=Acrasis kona TaxID=1008807 RepID=A0AAW2Z521_9EUKA